MLWSSGSTVHVLFDQNIFCFICSLCTASSFCMKHSYECWVTWSCDSLTLTTFTPCDIICSNHRPYIIYHLTVTFRVVLNVDKWFVIWEAVSVKMSGMWPADIGIQLGSGLGMAEMSSGGVLHCVSVHSHCLLCLYWCQFKRTEVSLLYS